MHGQPHIRFTETVFLTLSTLTHRHADRIMMEAVGRRELGTRTKYLVIEDGEQNLLF